MLRAVSATQLSHHANAHFSKGLAQLLTWVCVCVSQNPGWPYALALCTTPVTFGGVREKPWGSTPFSYATDLIHILQTCTSNKAHELEMYLFQPWQLMGSP